MSGKLPSGLPAGFYQMIDRDKVYAMIDLKCTRDGRGHMEEPYHE
jgi:hypothetical protein